MRRILLIPLIAIALVSFDSLPKTAGKDRDEDQRVAEEVLKVENEANQAWLKGRVEVLDRIWSNDIAYTSGDGQVVTKADFLNSLRIGQLKVQTIAHTDIRTHVYGNTVILTGYSRSKVETNGKIASGPRRFTNIYVKQDGRWQLVVHQVTLTRSNQ